MSAYQQITAQIPYEKRLEMILGVEKNAALQAVLGYNRLSRQDVEKFCYDIRHDLVATPRTAMEKDYNKLHFIPYILVRRRKRGGNKTEIAVYRRPATGQGEARLAGDHSVCLGGHVDIVDFVIGSKGHVDLYQTLIKNTWRELHEELIFTMVVEETLLTRCVKGIANFFKKAWSFVTKTDPELYSDEVVLDLSKEVGELCYLNTLGLIFDDSNDVGLTHLAVVMVLDIDQEIDVYAGNEDEVIDLHFMAPELIGDGYKFENWSKIVLNSLR